MIQVRFPGKPARGYQLRGNVAIRCKYTFVAWLDDGEAESGYDSLIQFSSVSVLREMLHVYGIRQTEIVLREYQGDRPKDSRLSYRLTTLCHNKDD